MKQENGFILKGIGGFYYVRTDSGVIECKARGKFRKSSQKPVIGDCVMIEVQDDGTGYIMSIEPRKNRLIRPAVSNIDQLVIVCSAAPPVTETLLIDKVTAIAEHKGMDVLIVINKCDINRGDHLYDIYTQAEFQVFRVSAQTGEGVGALREQLTGKISAFAGNSGVGKSSLPSTKSSRWKPAQSARKQNAAVTRHGMWSWWSWKPVDLLRIRRDFLLLMQSAWISS